MMKHWSEFKPKQVGNVYKMFGKRKWKKKIWYKELPITLDTESTSFKNVEGQKRACLYIWQMNVMGDTYYGRKTEEIPLFLDVIREAYNLDEDHKAIIYVHNLAWDAQFILPHLFVTRMFATDERRPLTFESDYCFEWRCSLRLSGKKLETLAEDWINEFPDLVKQKGFDYSLYRHHNTPLTDEEMKYAEYDVLVLYKYILTQIEEFGTICNIPLTNTGRARRYAYNECSKDKAFIQLFKKCTPKDPDLYRMLNGAFMGGVTHGNRIHVGVPLRNVVSFDLSSSYPSQIVKRKYPLTPFKENNIQDLEKFTKAFPDTAIVMLAKITNLNATTTHSIWSASKCLSIKNFEADNGRVMRAEEMLVMMTEIDYENLKMYYTFDIEVIKAYTSFKKYLPSCFVNVVLDLYEKKTALKGIPEQEREYKLGKALLNSLYGMCVTAMLHDDILYTYDDEKVDTMWDKVVLNINDDETVEASLEKFANDPKSFLLYQTGVWITAYARNDLLSTMRKIIDRAEYTNEDGLPIDDIVYYDTDSIKILHGDKYSDIFEDFNARNIEMHKEAMNHHGWEDRYNISDIKGRPHILGEFENDGTYEWFKTLGAKRYVDIEKGHFAVTICGVNKDKCAKYMIMKCGIDITDMEEPPVIFDNSITVEVKTDDDPDDPDKTRIYYVDVDEILEMFEDGMKIPAKSSGKSTCFYGDTEYVDSLTDYQGNVEAVHELAFVYLEATDFELKIAGDFSNLLQRGWRDMIV